MLVIPNNWSSNEQFHGGQIAIRRSRAATSAGSGDLAAQYLQSCSRNQGRNTFSGEIIPAILEKQSRHPSANCFFLITQTENTG